MLVVSNRIQVSQGFEKEFEERFAGRAGLVDKMPGFIRFEILRPIKSGPRAKNFKKRTAIGHEPKYLPGPMSSKCTKSSSTPRRAKPNPNLYIWNDVILLPHHA